jgi:hypothetical protein
MFGLQVVQILGAAECEGDAVATVERERVLTSHAADDEEPRTEVVDLSAASRARVAAGSDDGPVASVLRRLAGRVPAHVGFRSASARSHATKSYWTHSVHSWTRCGWPAVSARMVSTTGPVLVHRQQCRIRLIGWGAQVFSVVMR